MSDVLHIGFTGTRHGMSDAQFGIVTRCIAAVERERLSGDLTSAHHGDCEGADAQFHAICRGVRSLGVRIIVHPGRGVLRAFCAGDETMPVTSHMMRNAIIVRSSHIMIAAPFENEPQPRGGTWATIGMARRALKRGTLRAMYVVGREGQLLDHERWP